MKTSTEHVPSMLGRLLLTRLTAGGKPPAKGELVRVVTPFFSSEFRQSDKAWKELVFRTLEELAAAGLTTHPQKSIRITEAGQSVVCDFLKLTKLPDQRPTWSAFKRRYLFPLAVGTAPSGKAELSRAETTDGMKAAILVKLFGLQINSYPTLGQAMRALLANQGVTVSDVNQAQLCDGLIQNWLTEDQDERVTDFGATANQPNETIAEFAEQVCRIVRKLRGDSPVEKVLISEVWKQFEHETGTADRKRFDDQLLQASRRELLMLSEADLPGALPPTERQASEIETSNGRIVHFVRG